MAKKTLSDLLKNEWTKPNSGRLFPEFPERKTNASGRHHWVETYSPNCSRHCYYRYVWKERSSLRHRHISGGNVDNPKAIAMMERVERAIALGETPANIVAMIVRGENP
jgi:hypothetical protein